MRPLLLATAVLLGGLIAPVALPSPAAAQVVNVDEVRVDGNRRSEADAILAVVSTRAGQPIDRGQIREDIKAIFQLGFYTDVQVDLTVRGGKQVLTFVVREKPSVRQVVFEGNEELDDEEIGEVVDVKPFGVLDLAKVNTNAEKIRDLYIEKGYFLADVEWEVVDLPNNEVDVVFRVAEKQEVKVAKVTIVGNEALTESEITANLETREDSFLSFLTGAGSFKNEAFERDVVRVSQFYYDKGYITAKVGSPKVELSPDKTEIFVTIPVEEGDRYKTGGIDVTGDFIVEKEEILDLVRLEEGEWFSSGQLRETINAIGELYKDEGYAYVNVVPNTNVDPETKVVGLNLSIQKGKKVKFGRITVVGNDRTRDKVIRRELRIYEGDWYSSTGIKRSKARVTRLGYFETVEITTSPSDRDDRIDVVVEVKEKPTGTFQIGAGFSSIESFVAQAQVSENNLFGRGQTLSLQAQLSSIRQIINLRFSDDYIFDTKVRMDINLFRFETNFETFTRSSIGGSLTLGYPLEEFHDALEDLSVAVTYTLEDVEATLGGFGGTTQPIANLFTDGITSSVRLGFFHDTRNNRLFPSSGWFNSISVEQADEIFGSENLFTRYNARSRRYFDLTNDMVIKLNGWWSAITSPEKAGVPIFERFFVGGPLSVRGFRRASLGPTVPVFDSGRPDSGTTDQNIGGTERLIFNAEFEYPIFQKVGIRGVLFTDAGNAFVLGDNYYDKFASMRAAWGFGIRWFSPIGPLRFEWGFPYSPQEGEQGSVFDFSIGNFF